MAARQLAANPGVRLGRLLWMISDNARLCLILGLVAGLSFPALAAALEPWLRHMVAVLLFITALRIGYKAAGGAITDLRWGIGSVLLLQLAVPLLLLTGAILMGLSGTPATTAAVLATAAPTISGATNLALLLGQNPGRMMQIMVMGTAAFPLTVLPLLLLMPELGAPLDMVRAAGLTLLVICTATALGFWMRARVLADASLGQIKALDGLSVLAFCIIVVGLMAALNPALRSDPWQVALWMVLAFAISYGLQILTYLTLRRGSLKEVAGPLAIGAGNRNIAIFLIALPADVMAPLMIFVGCWQLPMYLTPILMRWLYRPHD